MGTQANRLFRAVMACIGISAVASALAEPVAFDMVEGATPNKNLTSYTVTAATDPITWSGGDWFGIGTWGSWPQATGMPFALADDSVADISGGGTGIPFPTDSLGIIDSSTAPDAPFLGAVDTVNGANPAGDARATWVFDTSSVATRGVSVSIDMAAMGDFETSDVFEWSYSIDGGPVTPLFTSSVDEAGSQNYTMESGTVVTLNDPLLINAVVLNDEFQTFTAEIASAGNELTIFLDANTNGGAEAFAAKNLVIEPLVSPFAAYDLVNGTSNRLNSFEVSTSGGLDPATGWSPGDWFGVGSWGSWPQGAGMPFAIADDSVVDISGGGAGAPFPTDTQGIVDSRTPSDEPFFSAVDTFNGANPAGTATATWRFDVSGTTGGFLVSIDMAAMGDFEAANDSYVWSYSIDGGAFQDILVSSVDEAGSQTYTMEGGALVTLNDPMQVNGVTLNDEFQTVSVSIAGTGSELALRLVGQSDGGAEAYAARNVIIEPLSSAVAFDLVNGTSDRLNSYGVSTSGGGDPAANWSPGDWFGVGNWGAWPQAAGMPFAIADDSVVDISGGGIGGPFPGDTQGIIDSRTPSDEAFFSAVDIVNGNNAGGTATATWRFDITGAEDLGVSIDMAAMGDFESAGDSYVWAYSIDGGAFQDIFVSSVDEAGSQNYTMEGGAVVTLNDPLQFNGVTLDDEFQTVSVAIADTGNELTLRLFGTADGGSEAYAARNIFITAGVFEPPVDPGPLDVKIHEVQGDGAISPLLGESVKIQGVVVGDLQEANELDGFYMQEEMTDEDLDPATSEGIFVFCGTGGCIDVNIGNVVTVTGNVDEFNNQTQIDNDSGDLAVVVDLGGNNLGLRSPATVTFPRGSAAELEAFEGMSVEVASKMHAIEYFNFDRFSEILVWTDGTGADRPYQTTQVNPPGTVDPTLVAEAFAAESITLDDGSTSQNIGKLFPENGFGNPIFGDSSFDAGNPSGGFRGGDQFSSIEGVLGESFGRYRIHIADLSAATAIDGGPFDIVINNTNPREAVPAVVGGSLKVATLNVLNYFTTIDDGSNNCGGDGTLNCRGADSLSELERQQAKLVAALAAMDADIVGLVEIENTPGVSAEQTLVDALNLVSTRSYEIIDTGAIGPDAIKVALIYDADTVTPSGDAAVLDSVDFVDPFATGTARNRPALAQTFEESATGAVVTVVVNHLKSKGSGCGPGDDDPEQGSCNLTRTVAAVELVNWLAADPTASGDPDFLIVGDLNSYAMEDPIIALKDADYTDLVNELSGDDAYSFVFNGRWGTLDYAMANCTLASQVTGVTSWHINADEPDALSYDERFNPSAWYEDDAFRASDHDPIIVGLNLGDSQPDPINDLAGRGKSSKISLTWSPVACATGYNVYRSSDPGGPYTQIAENHQSSYATYSDSGLATGTYYYVVTSILGGVESDVSNEARVTLSERRRR